MELVSGLMRNSLDFGGQNCQDHLLNRVGFYRGVEFALQDEQLLAQYQDFQVFLQVGWSTKNDEGDYGGVNVHQEGPNHRILCSTFGDGSFNQSCQFFLCKTLGMRFLMGTGC